jgi:hypothetical protein
MNCHRAPGACLLVLAAFFALDAASGGIPPAHAQEPETANACVGFQNAVGDKELVVHAGNDCERKLACTLDYVVRCEDNDRKVTSRLQKRALFNLAAKGNAELTLSAATCKQGWAIDDLAWTCH